MTRPFIHLALHFIVPAIVAHLAYRDRFWRAWLIMVLTMIVDLDHLLAIPIYDPSRCSIGFHPLHTYPAICAYALMTAIPKLRLVGFGLLIHMGLDFTDCLCLLF